MWKKVITVLCIALCLSCQELVKIQAGTKKWMADSELIKVFCTTAFVGSLVRSVGGEAVNVLDLIDGPNDPHSYQIVKGDDEKFRRADVIFYSGLGLEGGSTVRRLLEHYRACSVGDGISRRTGQALEAHFLPDPHMWMDVSLWARGLEVIEQRLSEVRPDLAPLFHANAVAAEERLMRLHESIRTLMASVPKERRYLVTTHDAFRYFCRAYLSSPEEQCDGLWKNRCIAPEGFSPESQMSLQDLRAAVAFIHSHRVRTICVEEGVNRDSVLKVVDVCRAEGDDVAISSDSIFSDTMGRGMTYEETMEHNAQVIFQSL
jgi:manganese/zinc/iron transport system substrate-binding protein